MNAILNEAKIFISPKMVNSRNNKINKMLKKYHYLKLIILELKKGYHLYLYQQGIIHQ